MIVGFSAATDAGARPSQVARAGLDEVSIGFSGAPFGRVRAGRMIPTPSRDPTASYRSGSGIFGVGRPGVASPWPLFWAGAYSGPVPR
jgi:hypothetical protein